MLRLVGTSPNSRNSPMALPMRTWDTTYRRRSEVRSERLSRFSGSRGTYQDAPFVEKHYRTALKRLRQAKQLQVLQVESKRAGALRSRDLNVVAMIRPASKSRQFSPSGQQFRHFSSVMADAAGAVCGAGWWRL